MTLLPIAFCRYRVTASCDLIILVIKEHTTFPDAEDEARRVEQPPDTQTLEAGSGGGRQGEHDILLSTSNTTVVRYGHAQSLTSPLYACCGRSRRQHYLSIHAVICAAPLNKHCSQAIGTTVEGTTVCT